MDASGRSVVRYVGLKSYRSCGYCKSTKRAKEKLGQHGDSLKNEGDESSSSSAVSDVVDRSVSFGLWASHLSVCHYQALVNKGWRRSGHYLYKPINERTCCPQYTIRLDVHKFRISRTQKRVLRTMFDFLRYDKRPTRTFMEEDRPPTTLLEHSTTERKSTKNEKNTIPTFVENPKPEKSCMKKKFLRKCRAEERLKNKGFDLEEVKANRRRKEESRKCTLESFFKKYVEGEWKHKFEMRLISVKALLKSEYLEETYLLYKKYQEIIHGENDVNQKSFECFLVHSPLFNPPNGSAEANIEPHFGSYHQQYVVDGKIVAVGVVDVLPRCFSAKYFFYDPDYSFLSFGTFSALCEIKFTKELALKRPELHYYYMGFYIYSCPKMRYKGKFRPSYLLCDKTFEWVQLSECDKLLETNNGKFTPFVQNEHPINQETPNIDDICCMVSATTAIRFRDFCQRYIVPSQMTAHLSTFAKYIGSIATEVFLIYAD